MASPLTKTASTKSSSPLEEKFPGPKSMNSSFDTFKIGKEEKEFIVYRKSACYNCPVFKAAFPSEPEEGRTQIYKIEDTTPRAFEMLVQWLDRRHIDGLVAKSIADDEYLTFLLGPEDLEKLDWLEKSKRESEDLIALWILGQKLILPALQNRAMDEIYLCANRFCLRQTVFTTVYENTFRGSPLRKLMVDFFMVWERSFISETIKKPNFPKEMLIELVDALTEKSRLENAIGKLEDYHIKAGGME